MFSSLLLSTMSIKCFFNAQANPNSFCFSVGMRLSEVAKLFDKSTLLQLKNECGGLQTLLRNHYYVFKGEFNLKCFDI